MTQHDVYANPNRRMRGAFPFLVVLQSDFVEGRNCILAPLVPPPCDASLPRGLPIVEHEGQRYVLMLTLLGTMPATLFRAAAGSLRTYRDDIGRGLDWLFFGV